MKWCSRLRGLVAGTLCAVFACAGFFARDVGSNPSAYVLFVVAALHGVYAIAMLAASRRER